MPYKQRVLGSNPCAPTKNKKGLRNFTSETLFHFPEKIALYFNFGLKNRQFQVIFST